MKPVLSGGDFFKSQIFKVDMYICMIMSSYEKQWKSEGLAYVSFRLAILFTTAKRLSH